MTTQEEIKIKILIKCFFKHLSNIVPVKVNSKHEIQKFLVDVFTKKGSFPPQGEKVDFLTEITLNSHVKAKRFNQLFNRSDFAVFEIDPDKNGHVFCFCFNVKAEIFFIDKSIKELEKHRPRHVTEEFLQIMGHAGYSTTRPDLVCSVHGHYIYKLIFSEEGNKGINLMSLRPKFEENIFSFVGLIKKELIKLQNKN
jgi:hypothetical protein